MAEHAAVIRIARYQAAAGKRDELLKILQDGTNQIREMEGCFGAQICSSNQSSDALVAVSRWASQAAVDNFLTQSASQRAQLSGLISGQPQTEHLTSL